MNLSLSLDGPSGLATADGGMASPDADGVLFTATLSLPAWTEGAYWAPVQRHDLQYPRRGIFKGHNGANRIQPLRITAFDDLVDWGMFLLLRCRDGQFLAVLPIVSPLTVAWLHHDGGRLVLKAGTLGTERIEATVPLAAWVKAADPYDACRAAWRMAVASPPMDGSTRLRCEKHYPEVFEHLGWCSWEQYKGDINEALLVEAIGRIESGELPIRYVLIDDGHFQETAPKDGRLVSFTPSREKFPGGWRPVMLARGEKVRWMGLWLNFNGYWKGVHPENELGGLNAHLTPVSEAALQPKDDPLSAFAFYDAMVGAAWRAGFSFVKVDNQANNVNHYRGRPHAVRPAARNAQALEAVCARHMDGLLNCMAHGMVSICNTRCSVVTRCSEDYQAGHLPSARRHLFDSFANIAWLGQTAWGDHDMFHSSDPVAGRMMAVSKALSGGPVYLSDAPEDFVPEHIRPLCYEDGRLLRPLAPAAPLPESLFLDPYEDGRPFRVIAPLAGGAAAVCVYNLTEPEVPVVGFVRPDDYAHAACMIQPAVEPWAMPEEGLLVHDTQTGTARRLDGEHRFKLPGFADRLLFLLPIRRGWAVIGRTDKYLAPAAAEWIDATADELIVRMAEPGPLAVWSDRGEPRAEGVEATPLGDGLWRLQVTDGCGPVLRIRR